MQRIILLFVLTFGILTNLFSQIPEDYYSEAIGHTGQELKQKLHNIIDDHQEKTYDDLWDILIESDEDPENSNNFILIYTGRSISKSATYPDWNREHVWAKSHGDFGNTPPAGTDAHHIKPCDVSVNSTRSNLDFDNGGSQHEEATECYYDSDSWEPRDEVKGDVARIMFYMAVRYEGDVSGEPDLELEDFVPTSGPFFGKLSTLLEWHSADPVNEFERTRNDIVYSYQNNRNPFIDHPEFVSLIWGDEPSNVPPLISDIRINPVYPTSHDSVFILANITDQVGKIDTVWLDWGLEKGILVNSIPMIKYNNLYKTIDPIPANSDSSKIYYKIFAQDDSSAISESATKKYMVNDSVKSIIEENFVACPADGWINYSISGSNDWHCTDEGNMEVNAYSSDEACNDWLILPAYNPALFKKEIFLFDSWTKHYDENFPQLTIKYATSYTEGEDPTKFNWKALDAAMSAEDSETWVNSGNIDLSEINSDKIHIAFHYISTGTAAGNAAQWKIDNVKLLGFSETNDPPILKHFLQIPENPAEIDTTYISARITDEQGISAAFLKWNTTSSSDSAKMIYNGSRYEAKIPPFQSGSTVNYKITATNYAGITAESESFSFIPEESILVPHIDSVWIDPEEPDINTNVGVCALIKTDLPLIEKQLLWGTNSGQYADTLEMNLSDTLYKGTIPANPGIDTAYFKLQLRNTYDSTAISKEYKILYNTTATNEIAVNSIKKNIRIYPNPTSNLLIVEGFKKNYPDVRVSLVDLSGRRLYLKNFNNLNGSRIIVNLRKIPRGTYILNITTPEFSLNKKQLIK